MKHLVRQSLLAALFCLVGGAAMARHHGGHPSPPPSQGSGQSGGEASVGTAGQFDYYLLTLSWSPNYCVLHPNDADQCGGKGFGFVLHGLWPQYASGGYPQNCATPNTLTKEAIAYGVHVFPSPKLIQHEWSKHGTCSGFDALDYFKTADSALASVHVPPAMQAPASPLSMPAADIAAAFVSANPGMTKDELVVACSGPALAEVRVCLNRDLTPVPCGKGVRSSCRPGAVRIQSVR
jgi:ribonuclease T2